MLLHPYAWPRNLVPAVFVGGTLVVQLITRASLAPVYTAASSGGDNYRPGVRTFLHVKNASGGSVTVTVKTYWRPVLDITTEDVTVVVPGGGERMLGPLDSMYIFADAANGYLGLVTYSAVTGVTVAALATSNT
jgi:hypothetical protein